MALHELSPLSILWLLQYTHKHINLYSVLLNFPPSDVYYSHVIVFICLHFFSLYLHRYISCSRAIIYVQVLHIMADMCCVYV